MCDSGPEDSSAPLLLHGRDEDEPGDEDDSTAKEKRATVEPLLRRAVTGQDQLFGTWHKR